MESLEKICYTNQSASIQIYKNFKKIILTKFMSKTIQSSRPFKTLIYGGIATSLYCLIKRIVQQTLMEFRDRKWEQVRQKKRQLLKSQIQEFQELHMKYFQLPNELKDQILNANVETLKKLLSTRKVSVVQLLLTFIERAITIAFPNGWLSDIIFEEALELAIYQDELIKNDVNIIYQKGNHLFGIPITIKDQLIIKGQDSSFGTASRLFKPYSFDSNQVHLLKEAGAVIFAKTSMVQLGIVCETNNFTTGRISSIYSAERSSGGSSGGQGACVGAKVSILGVGTDLGGSIRIPASFNGVCGYKPSTRRQFLGGSSALPWNWFGQKNMIGCAGPIANFVDDLKVVLKCWWDSERYKKAPFKSKSIYQQPLEWNDELYKPKNHQKLRIGYIKQFEILPVCKAVKRAIDESIKILQDAGHELVPFEIDNQTLEEAWRLIGIFILGEGGFRTQYEALNGEKLIVDLSALEKTQTTPRSLIRIWRTYLELIGRKRSSLEWISHDRSYDAFDYLNASGLQGKMQTEMALKWEQLDLDAVISPVSAHAPFRHKDLQSGFLQVIYTIIWNFYDYSAGVVPITYVQEHEQVYDVIDTYSRGDDSNETFRKNLENSAGLPISVQVITRPFHDEKCLSIMNLLEKKLQ